MSGKEISVARVGGRLYAFDDLWTCADEACPLSGGLLTVGEVAGSVPIRA